MCTNNRLIKKHKDGSVISAANISSSKLRAVKIILELLFTSRVVDTARSTSFGHSLGLRAKRFVAFKLLEASGRLGSYAAAYSDTGPGKGGSYKYISYIWDLPFPGGLKEKNVIQHSFLR